MKVEALAAIDFFVNIENQRAKPAKPPTLCGSPNEINVRNVAGKPFRWARKKPGTVPDF